MSINAKNSVFTVSTEMIPKNKVLPYDLYINSSGREGYERFVCICRQGRTLSENELYEIQQRFHNVYVREVDRGNFLKAFTDVPGVPRKKGGAGERIRHQTSRRDLQ